MKIFSHIVFVCLIGLSLISCVEKKGCTDTTANNYDSSAEIDDGSCSYPSLEDNINGVWKFLLKDERNLTDTSDGGFSVTSIPLDSVSGEIIFNFDGSGTIETGDSTNTENFEWALDQDTVTISSWEDAPRNFTVEENSVIKQLWTSEESFVDSSNIIVDVKSEFILTK